MENENTPEDLEFEASYEDEELTDDGGAEDESLPEQEDDSENEETSKPAKTDLILGKYGSQDELANAYLNMQGEYTKIRQSLKDPNFVYTLAKEAGLAGEENGEEEKPDINKLVSQQVQATLQATRDYEQAVQIVPELGTDPRFEAWGRALVEMGNTHTQAAKIIKETLGKTAQVAKVAGAKEKETAISDKEAAQTAPSIVSVNSDHSELETLKEQAKSLNRQEQENALAKLLEKTME